MTERLKLALLAVASTGKAKRTASRLLDEVQRWRGAGVTAYGAAHAADMNAQQELDAALDEEPAE